LLRSTLGDLQTGVVDINNLRIKFTDPVSTALLTEIESDLSKCEQAVAKLYRARAASQEIKSPKPSTSPAVKM
jgi:protease I